MAAELIVAPEAEQDITEAYELRFPHVARSSEVASSTSVISPGRSTLNCGLATRRAAIRFTGTNFLKDKKCVNPD